jgi:uncharacterized protein YifN (PemK superfamily)
MSITIHPRPGQILYCDFSTGFKEPEAVKKRPVLILTPSMRGRPNLTTIVILSTSRPNPIEKYHYLLPKASLPILGDFQRSETWVKGDMVYAVGYHRLDLIKVGRRGSDGKRQYFTNRLGRERMRDIYACVLHGLNLGEVAAYIPE